MRRFLFSLLFRRTIRYSPSRCNNDLPRYSTDAIGRQLRAAISENNRIAAISENNRIAAFENLIAYAPSYLFSEREIAKDKDTSSRDLRVAGVEGPKTARSHSDGDGVAAKTFFEANLLREVVETIAGTLSQQESVSRRNRDAVDFHVDATSLPMKLEVICCI